MEYLNLDKCVRICKAAELAEHQIKTLEEVEKIYGIKTQRNKAYNRPQTNAKGDRQQRPVRGNSSKQADQEERAPQQRQQDQRRQAMECKKCCRSHDR